MEYNTYMQTVNDLARLGQYTSEDGCAAAPSEAVLAKWDKLPGRISNAPDEAELALVPVETCIDYIIVRCRSQGNYGI